MAGAVPPDRLVELIRTEGGTPIAVVIADPGLDRYRGLFNAAVQICQSPLGLRAIGAGSLQVDQQELDRRAQLDGV